MPRTSDDSIQESLLATLNVSKRFGGVQALRDVTLWAHSGGITGLIGPNGAGKSTLLSIIGGAMRPDSGSVRLGGLEFADKRPGIIARSGLLRTFQHASPVQDLTVLDNVLLGASQHIAAGGFRVVLGSSSLQKTNLRIKEEARSLLERLGLVDVENRAAKDLSFGQLRLLEVARALMAKPKVLLLDEPVAGLNVIETQHLGGVLKELADEGLAVVVVDHDIPFMLGLCEQVFVLDYGAIIASGPPEEVEASPTVRAAYLGGDDIDVSGKGE